MPSGKRAKQQRRVAVPPPPKGGAGLGARRASPAVLAIAGGAIVIIVLAVVLAIVLTNGSGGGSTTSNGLGDTSTILAVTGTPAIGSSTGPNAFADAPDVAKLLNGIPQHGFVLGNPNAPVTLIEYIDLQCPICKSFETTELQPLVKKYVKPGQLKIELKAWNIIDANYPGDDDSLRGQKAVVAAAAQNRAFQFAEVLYNNQRDEGSNWLNDAFVSNIAASVDGMNMSKFVTDANSPATQQQVSDFDAAGNQVSQVVLNAGQQPGTPTLLLQQGSGKPKLYGVGYPTLTNLEASIDALLK